MMDPTACFNRMATAFDECDYEEAQHAAEDLAGWLCNGGAMPEVYPRDWLAIAAWLQELAIRNQTSCPVCGPAPTK